MYVIAGKMLHVTGSGQVYKPGLGLRCVINMSHVFMEGTGLYALVSR